MNYLNSVAFRGNGETAGSVSYMKNKANCPPQNPDCGQVNFRGYDYYDKPEKETSAFAKIATFGSIAAFAIGGLAFAHKKNCFAGLKDGGKLKQLVAKLEPAAQKCHNWCTKIKTKSLESWDKMKSFFKGKKD